MRANPKFSSLVFTVPILVLRVAAQTPPSKATQIAPLRVLQVVEAPRLDLKTSGGFTGSAEAGEGRRYVTVRLEFQSTLESIENRTLILLSDDGQVFPSDGIGDEENKFCMMPGISLKREEGAFGGFCAMTRGGPVSLAYLKAAKPAGAFVVPAAIPLSALRISYGFGGAAVPVEPPAVTSIGDGVTVELKGLDLGDSARRGARMVTFLAQIHNAGKTPIQLHRGVVGLVLPQKLNAQGKPEYQVPPQLVGIVEAASSAGVDKASAKPFVKVAAGQASALGLQFNLSPGVDASGCQLLFRQESSARLGAK